MSPSRTFTPSSARACLNVVRPAAERMCRLFRAMERMRPPRIDGDTRVDADYFRMLGGLMATLGVLRRSGAHVRDPRRGLLDFPARRAGKAVWLCWQVGEPTLEYWHEWEGGFKGRRRVDEQGPWEG